MNHVFKSSKPNDLENSLCFHILGIDVFLDHQLKAWLLEVNQSPSFVTDSPFDHLVKKNLIRDSLHILNLSWKRKTKCMNKEKAEMALRLIGKVKKNNNEDRDLVRENNLRKKDKFENTNLGDF